MRACTETGNLGKYKCPNITLNNGSIIPTFCGNPYDPINYIAQGLDLDRENLTTNSKIFYGVATFNNIASSMIAIN
jgi:hypothetical protein